MKTMHLTCDNCAGLGYLNEYHEVSRIGETVTMERKEVICEKCSGKGYLEYAIFSMDEAKAILKHCGLSTES